MYVPPLFAVRDDQEIADFCRAHPFATLVTSSDDGLFATHLPVIPATDGTAFHGHIARANPHWEKATDGAPAILIFQGPQAYVTPSWYETKRQTAKVVPTWNYAAVHAHGHVFWPQHAEFLRQNLNDLTDTHEARFAHPWAMTDAPETFLALQMKAIVGFRFVVSRVDAKRKMSQNRPEADINGVIAGLRQSEDAMDRTVSQWVDQARPGRSDPG